MTIRPWVPHPRHPNAIPPVTPLSREIAALIVDRSRDDSHANAMHAILYREWYVDYVEVE